MIKKRGIKISFSFNLTRAIIIFMLLLFMAIIIANQPAINVMAQTNQSNDTEKPITQLSFSSEDWQNSDILIELICQDNYACNVTYYCIDTTNSCNPSTPYTYSFIYSTEGVSYIRFYSIDKVGNVEDVKSQVLKIDKTKPSISISSPQNGERIEGNSFIINGTASDSMSDIKKVEISIDNKIEEVVGTNIWQYNWQNFIDGIYKITAIATDKAGNTQNVSVNVEVDNPPFAKIVSIDNNHLVKAGRIEVVLQTSEPVQSTPSLSYSFTNEGPIKIPLEGSSQEWRGYMVIGEDDDNKVATFSFSATDLKGNVGNIITQGSYFVVDAKKPPRVINVRKEIDGNEVKINWFYEGETLKQFNIYRSEKQGVDYTYYYKSVPPNATSTIDDLDGKTYYYRIAAVDLAGNLGPLSDEIVAVPENTEQEQQVNQESAEVQQTQTQQVSQRIRGDQTLPYQVINDIEAIRDRINANIVEIEKVALVLEKNPVAKELGLITQLNDGKATLNGFRSRLNTISSSGSSNIENVKNEIQKINLQIGAVINDLPKKIIQEGEESFIQDTSLKDIEEATRAIGIAENDNSITYNQRLQRNVEVKVTAKHLKVELFGGEKEVTLIKKEILTAPSNVSVVEIIPKQIAQTASEIKFITEGYEIVKNDPIVKWSPDKNIKEIKYFVEKKVSESDLQETKTVVISERVGYGIITGLAIAGKRVAILFTNIKLILGLVILAGLVVFYFIYLKEDPIEKNYRPFKLKEESIAKTLQTRQFSQTLTQPLSIQQNRMGYFRSVETKAIKKHFYELVSRINLYIDELNFSLAKRSYPLLLEMYKQLSNIDKSSVYKELVHVYNKLMLYSKIKECKSVERNTKLARHIAREIASLYSSVISRERKDTKFLKAVRNYYNNLVFLL